MNNKELLDKLSKLGLEEKYIKRQLNVVFYNKEKRHEMFQKLEKVKKEILNVKRALSEEKRRKYENNNTDSSKN